MKCIHPEGCQRKACTDCCLDHRRTVRMQPLEESPVQRELRRMEAGNPPDIKLDAGKPPVSRGFLAYFPRAIAAVADVSQYGFEKYKVWGGWRSTAAVDAVRRYEDAMARHYMALKRGEVTDPESGRSHRAMVAWNALAVLELEETEREAGFGAF